MDHEEAERRHEEREKWKNGAQKNGMIMKEQGGALPDLRTNLVQTTHP